MIQSVDVGCDNQLDEPEQSLTFLMDTTPEETEMEEEDRVFFDSGNNCIKKGYNTVVLILLVCL